MARGGFNAGYDVGTFSLKFIIVLLLVLLIIPPIGVAIAIYLIVTRNNRHPAWLLAAAAAIAAAAYVVAAWWYPSYIGMRYYERLPIGQDLARPAEYQAKLAEAGFTNVAVVVDREPGETACHQIERVDAVHIRKYGNHVRKDSPVVIHVGCW